MACRKVSNVYKIVAGGAASRSDLRERDIITKFDGEKVKNGDDLKKLLTYYKAGSTVTMTVQSLENGQICREKRTNYTGAPER